MRDFCQLHYFIFTRARLYLRVFNDSHFGVTSVQCYKKVLIVYCRRMLAMIILYVGYYVCCVRFATCGVLNPGNPVTVLLVDEP
jgi:hypothetical protein